MTPPRPGSDPCPRCGRGDGVVEEKMSNSPLRWFRCLICAHVWSVQRAANQVSTTD